MTEEALTRDIKEIVEGHLKGMVYDIEWKLLMTVDNYADVICKTYADELFKCFSPLITLKLGGKENEKGFARNKNEL